MLAEETRCAAVAPNAGCRTMDREHRERLIKCRKMIVDDLEVKVVMDFLLEKGILDQESQERIFIGQTSSDRARRLLDLLPTRGPRAFPTFVQALKEDYNWIAEALEEKSLGEDKGDENNEEALLQSILLKGGVPLEPSHNITRRDALKKLKQGLANLKSGRFLVIHGMPGSGKSVLAADAVRDSNVTLTYFPDGVFWFRVGMLEKDKLFNRMKILCEKLDAHAVPTSLEHAQEILRKLLLSDRYSKSLIILDDVWSSEIIKSFNLSGRVLVTTQDISVMDVVASQKEVIAVNCGFTEKESLELFSSYVDLPPEFLPEEAKLIHYECKGSPMVISMIGGLISETGSRNQQRQRQSGRWAYYYNNLKSRKYSKFKKQRSYQHDSVMEAVMLSIENLGPKLKQRYQELAVFLDDVGIPTKVLMTYWDMDQIEVEDVMTELLKKSLAQSEFDTTLDSYVYSIHDLQLDYLKNQLRDNYEKEKELHKHFLEQYFRKCNYQYGRIKDDSYIFYNFGYHLFKSEQFHLFPSVYLDLSFVEAMLKSNGPVDLLNDYKKFEDHIMGMNKEHIDALEDFEAFARTIGALVSNSPYTDIIQLALREPETSAVYKSAKLLAVQRPEKLYFEWINRSQTRGQHLATILHHGAVEAARFLTDITKILTSNGDGQIKVWDVNSGEVLHRFTGHKSNVGTLALSPDGDLFASGSEKGAIKIWDLGSFLDDSEDSAEAQREVLRKTSMKSRSNSLRSVPQQTVNSLITFDHDLRDLSNQSFMFNELHYEMVLCVAFSPNGEEVVASGRSGLVKVFNLRARSLKFTIAGHGEAVNKCCYSWDGSSICTASDDATVRLWTSDKGEFLGSNNRHSLRVLDVAFVPNSTKFVSMSADKLIQWDSPVTAASAANIAAATEGCTRSLSMEVVEFRRTREAFFNCMALSNGGEKLAAGTVDNMITVWDVASAQVLLSLPGHSNNIYVLDFTHDDSFLLSGSADETVMIWSMEDVGGDSGSSLSLGPSFDAKFFHDQSSRLVAPDDTNSLRVLFDGRPVFRSPAETFRITAVALSADGETVAYGCENGIVRLFRPSMGMVKHLGMHRGRVNDVKVSSDGIKVISAGEDQVVKIFHDGDKLFSCHGSTGPVKEVHFFAKDQLLLSLSADGSVRTWSMSDGKMLKVESAEEDDHVTFVDGNLETSALAVAKASGRVTLLNLVSLELIRDLNPNGQEHKSSRGPVRICRFSGDGKLLGVGYDGGAVERMGQDGLPMKGALTRGVVQVWDVNSGLKLYQPLCTHETWVRDIYFSEDNLRLVTVGDKIAWWTLAGSMAAVRKRGNVTPGILTSQVSSSPQLRKTSYGSISRATGGSLFGRRKRLSEAEDDIDGTSPSPSSGVASGKRSSKAVDNVVKVGSSSNRELLQTFDIRGSSMFKVFADKDFKKFITVDDAGITYILEEIKPVEFSS